MRFLEMVFFDKENAALRNVSSKNSFDGILKLNLTFEFCKNLG
jgi:hypothetical protein